MELWFTIIVSIAAAQLIYAVFKLLRPRKHRLPPTGNRLQLFLNWARDGLGGLEAHVRHLHRRLGPIVNLQFKNHSSIYVNDPSLAHEAFIQNGAMFADRPKIPLTGQLTYKDHPILSSSSYGPTYRTLRRNLIANILNPSRLRSYSPRTWVLQILVDRLRTSTGEEPVVIPDHLHYAMFALLCLMCFGDKLDEKQINQIEFVTRRQIEEVNKFNILNIWPAVTKFFLRKTWAEFYQHKQEQLDVLLPLVQARRKFVQEKEISSKNDYVFSYIDSLFTLELPDRKETLSDEEIVSLCKEFLIGGTDTTSTTMQWIFAHLVKNPDIQTRLYEEIKSVMGERIKEEIGLEDLQKLPYNKAVILEGLRRHPPGPFMIPHGVREDTVLGGYFIPKNSTVNIALKEIGMNPNIWEDPAAFKPERFIDGKDPVDVTGTKGVKMLPFGVGRRICPATSMALVTLEFFLANLVKNFEYKAVEGEDVDFSEKLEFVVTMKYPVKAYVVPR